MYTPAGKPVFRVFLASVLLGNNALAAVFLTKLRLLDLARGITRYILEYDVMRSLVSGQLEAELIYLISLHSIPSLTSMIAIVASPSLESGTPMTATSLTLS